MRGTKIKFTYADYKSLPVSETRRYELLGGEIVIVPAPTEPHQRVVRDLGFMLWEFVRKNGLGWVCPAPLDVVLGEGENVEVVQPDVIFISQERRSLIQKEEIHGAPDLVVEVLSPGTEERDRHYKKTLYARHGIQEYWIVDPERKTAEVYTLGESGFELVSRYRGDGTLVSPLLPGLAIPLREIFAEL
jgi:Uma2 family endonuclease